MGEGALEAARRQKIIRSRQKLEILAAGEAQTPEQEERTKQYVTNCEGGCNEARRQKINF